jgi:signal transduction histidine kinase
MVRSIGKRFRRAAPIVALSLAAVVGGVSLWQALQIVTHLGSEARSQTRIFGSIVAALQAPTPELQTDRLFATVLEIRETGLPLILTDRAGNVSVCANLALEPDPCDLASGDLADPRILIVARDFAQSNAPVVTPDSSQIYFGSTESARQLTLLAVLQLTVLAVAVFAGIWGYRSAAHLHRDRLWVAMARESAHQLGTPLMSVAAWIERLRDVEPDTKKIAKHLRADLDRLERVAQRFERIGRPARQERVGMGSLTARVATYFEPRLPRHANKIAFSVHAPSAGPMVSGDPVLLEWAVEALIRNSIDALSGRGGCIDATVSREGDRVRLVVEDDGPGVGIEVMDTLFEPGITTKSGGWGIGLALANRIFEDVHGGQLRFESIESGARFVAELPALVG